MIFYYIILIFLLCVLLKYNDPSINSRDLCLCICLAIILLFILINAKLLFSKTTYTNKNTEKYENMDVVKSENIPVMVEQSESIPVMVKQPENIPVMIEQSESMPVMVKQPENIPVMVESIPVMKEQQENKSELNLIEQEKMQENEKRCKINLLSRFNKVTSVNPYTLTMMDEDYILSGGLVYDLNNPRYPLLNKNQDLIYNRPLASTNVNEDYILSQELENDLQNPKYPLLENNQDMAIFPASHGEIECIINKYKHNGDFKYDKIYSLPKNMSYNNANIFMDLNKVKSLYQQSPLI